LSFLLFTPGRPLPESLLSAPQVEWSRAGVTGASGTSDIDKNLVDYMRQSDWSFVARTFAVFHDSLNRRLAGLNARTKQPISAWRSFRSLLAEGISGGYGVVLSMLGGLKAKKSPA
jgi:hypothetical protein